MNNKIKAFAILPVAAALTFFGLQAVSASFADTTTYGETPATTGAMAQTIDDCDWYLDGVEDTLSLINETGGEYVGDDYVLTATNEGVKIYFSGTEDEEVRCSFYDDVRGVDVEVSWEAVGAGFASTDAEDTSLNWLLGAPLETGGGLSSLDVEYTPVLDSCSDKFTAGGTVSIDGVETSPITPASISGDNTATFTPSSPVGTETWAACTLNASYSVTLPGNKRPNNPGGSYTFTGPTLTTTITVNELATPPSP